MTPKGAESELNRSLERLHTDHFDLYQFHAVTTMKDVDEITGPGGAAELFLQAKKDGRVRYVGFSAHNPDAAIALMDRFPADSVLFPVNFVTWSQGSFGPQILEAARKKGIRRLALKAMAYTKWPEGVQGERPRVAEVLVPAGGRARPRQQSRSVHARAGHHRRNPAR